jgi:aldehyde dehydrogenase (NAD+)
MAREMGKVLPEAAGDVQEAIDMSFYMGGEGRRLFGQTTPSELQRQVQHERTPADRRRRRDHALGTSRSPSRAGRSRRRSSAGTRSSSSPPTDTPLLGERFVELLVEAGVPGGRRQHRPRRRGRVGDRLVRHPDVP